MNPRYGSCLPSWANETQWEVQAVVEQTYAPISRVDIDRLYADGLPESWLDLEVRTVEFLEGGVFSPDQSRALVMALRELAERGESVPPDPGDLYLMVMPLLEKMPGGYG